MKHLVTMAERKGCHGGGTKMVPRQHSGPGNSIEIPMQERSVRMSVSCKRWWGDPGYRVSHMTVAWQKRGIASDNSITVQTRASHTTKHAFVHGRSSSRDYTFEACIRGGTRFVEGSRRSRDVVEVVVHVS